jgi:glutamyl-tRNA synthetase
MIAVVVDDHSMGVTHVMRGDDHLSNTPKQILLYNALGYPVPMFGHMPLILGTDKKRLSKRHGATAVGEYQTRGILPEALFNFLALLGWSPGDDREVMTRDEMVEAFDARRLLKKSSVFDEVKLAWMNGQHLRQLDDADILERLRPWRPASLHGVPDEYLLTIIPLMKERIELLSEFFDKATYFFADPASYDEAGVKKHWKPDTGAQIALLVDAFASCSFDAVTLEEIVRRFAEERGHSAGKVIHPLRLALTGGTQSPSLFDMMVVLGREVCLRRLQTAVEKVGSGE